MVSTSSHSVHMGWPRGLPPLDSIGMPLGYPKVVPKSLRAKGSSGGAESRKVQRGFEEAYIKKKIEIFFY